MLREVYDCVSVLSGNQTTMDEAISFTNKYNLVCNKDQPVVFGEGNQMSIKNMTNVNYQGSIIPYKIVKQQFYKANKIETPEKNTVYLMNYFTMTEELLSLYC